MFKSAGIALLTAMTMVFFAPAVLSAQEDIQKLWEVSSYAHPGKGMRTMKMMHMMDTNKDGKVAKEEFMRITRRCG
jgi:phytoene dehydrogenase-like protein